MIPLAQPEQFSDALAEVLRSGASRLLTAAIEAEVEAHLAAYSDLKLPDGRQRIVLLTPLPERKVQTETSAIYEQGKWPCQVIREYFAYHAVPTNSASL